MGDSVECFVDSVPVNWDHGVYLCDVDHQLLCRRHALNHGDAHVINNLSWQDSKSLGTWILIHCQNCYTSICKCLTIGTNADLNLEYAGPRPTTDFIGYMCWQHCWSLCAHCLTPDQMYEKLKSHRLQSHAPHQSVSWVMYLPTHSKTISSTSGGGIGILNYGSDYGCSI